MCTGVVGSCCCTGRGSAATAGGSESDNEREAGRGGMSSVGEGMDTKGLEGREGGRESGPSCLRMVPIMHSEKHWVRRN